MAKSSRVWDENAVDAELAIVAADINGGRMNEARERLRALPLIVNHKHCRLLGDLYYRVGMSAMAGRYWYFEEHPTDEMNAAIRLFEDCCGNSPLMIRSSLHFCPHQDHAHAKVLWKALLKEEERVSDLYDYYFETKEDKRASRQRQRVVFSIVMFLVVSLLFLGVVFVAGLITGEFTTSPLKILFVLLFIAGTVFWVGRSS